jgi:hypothetical protein
MRQSGIALVSVLWLLLLLSGLAATVAYVARVNAILARGDLDLARAQAAAGAAVINTLSRLSDEETSRRPSMTTSTQWEFDHVQTSTDISNEAERIDLNAASDEVIFAFLQSQGVQPQSAGNLLKQLRARQGAAAGPAGTRSNALKMVDELDQLSEWRGKVSCWRDSLTVYSGQAAPTHPTLPANQSLIGQVLRIRSTSGTGQSAATSEWIGRLTGDPAKPMLTLAWSHESPALAQPPCETLDERTTIPSRRRP